MKRGQTIVFVCKHGSAKSVVAAAHFNRLADGQGLGLRAVSRGTNPDTEIAPNADAGLRAGGLPPVSEDYAKARDVIVERIRLLLDGLEARD